MNSTLCAPHYIEIIVLPSYNVKDGIDTHQRNIICALTSHLHYRILSLGDINLLDCTLKAVKDIGPISAHSVNIGRLKSRMLKQLPILLHSHTYKVTSARQHLQGEICNFISIFKNHNREFIHLYRAPFSDFIADIRKKITTLWS